MSVYDSVKMIYETSDLTIIWGDASLAVQIASLEGYRQGQELKGIPWDTIKQQLSAMQKLFFAHQVHGAKGYVVTPALVEKSAPWVMDGDYLLTNEPGIGIGILTADCLPIVIYDSGCHACAVIHAGWRSSVAGIAVRAIEHMKEVWGSEYGNLRLFFGPCAGRCCYKVGSEIIEAVGTDAPLVTERRADGTFFDLIGYNQLLLERVGIAPSQFSSHYRACTICDTRFCSYRREKEDAGRQVTIVCLHERNF